MQLPQRRSDDIWRRKYYPKPVGLEIGTLIFAVSPSKMFFFFFRSIVQCWAKTMGWCFGSGTKLLFGRDPTWKPLVSRVCGQTCARTHTHTLVPETNSKHMIESIIFCFLITRLFFFWLTTTFSVYFLPCHLKDNGNGRGVIYLNLLKSETVPRLTMKRRGLMPSTRHDWSTGYCSLWRKNMEQNKELFSLPVLLPPDPDDAALFAQMSFVLQLVGFSLRTSEIEISWHWTF